MIKFEHSIFALPFAYLGLFLAARGWPGWGTFLWVTVAMVSFRTAGMAFNRLVDRQIDAKNPRTSDRALPAKRLDVKWVWSATLISLVIFEISAYQLGELCFKLSPIPVFLSILYSYMKRFTWLCHFVLGMILGIAPYGAWLASQNQFSWVPGLITLGVMTWVAGFDMIYALQDYDFDLKEGLFSFPARFGKERTFAVTQILHTVTVLSWLGAGWLANLGIVYYLGIALVSFFLLREHWLIRSFGLRKIQEAFFTMNAVVSLAVFVAAMVDCAIGG